MRILIGLSRASGAKFLRGHAAGSGLTNSAGFLELECGSRAKDLPRILLAQARPQLLSPQGLPRLRRPDGMSVCGLIHMQTYVCTYYKHTYIYACIHTYMQGHERRAELAQHFEQLHEMESRRMEEERLTKFEKVRIRKHRISRLFF